MPKTILEAKAEEEEGEKIKYVPLSERNCLAREIKEWRRRSSIVTPPSSPREPLQVSTLEDENKKWIDDMKGQEIDVFDLSKFDFM